MCKSNLLNNIGKTIKAPECSHSCSLQRCLIYKNPYSSEAGDSAGEAPLFHELGEYIFIFYAWAAEVECHSSSGEKVLSPVADQVFMYLQGLPGPFLETSSTVMTAMEHFPHLYMRDMKNITEK